jgi:hypothetical protein
MAYTEKNFRTKKALKDAVKAYNDYRALPESERAKLAGAESSSAGRVRLIWDEQRQNISLLLPAISREKLPASWGVGSLRQEAAPSPDELVLNSDSFASMLAVTLQLGDERETQYVRGINNWALFDLENGGRLVNVSRDQLPLRSYALISQCEIELVSRDGFDDSDYRANERFELKDGTVCFLTRLWPTGKYAELCLKIGGRDSRTIRFK